MEFRTLREKQGGCWGRGMWTVVGVFPKEMFQKWNVSADALLAAGLRKNRREAYINSTRGWRTGEKHGPAYESQRGKGHGVPWGSPQQVPLFMSPIIKEKRPFVSHSPVTSFLCSAPQQNSFTALPFLLSILTPFKCPTQRHWAKALGPSHAHPG